LELHKAGANVTVLYRGDTYPDAVKPWILPKFDALVQKGIVTMEFQAEVKEITPETVVYQKKEKLKSIHNDFVFAMTGYRPNMDLLKQVGVAIDPATNIPHYKKTRWKQTSVIAILQALLLREIKTMPSSLKPVESMEESSLMLSLKTNKKHLYLLPEFILSFKEWDCFISK